MMLSERRRALMAGGGGSWYPAFGVSYRTTEYYQSGATLEQGEFYVFTEFPPEKLVGASSEYVIATFPNENQLCVIPRANLSSSSIDGVKCLLKIQDGSGGSYTATDVSILAVGTFNFKTYGDDITYQSSTAGREHYYIASAGHVPSADDFYFEFYYNSMPDPGGGGECPSGGSHDFSTAGQPAYPLPDYQCPSCGQTGFCAQQMETCTKCGAMSEFVRCQNCGWQSG